MASGKGKLRVVDIHANETKVDRIRRLNDAFRRSPGLPNRVAITCGIEALGAVAVVGILQAVTSFDDFSTDNDPYFEHDMGAFPWGSSRIFWKIDYYDRQLNAGSSDPSDPAVTTRVLTIMLASEY